MVMKKLILVGLVGVAIGWWITDSKSAMQKCQEKFSYGTCVSLLR